MWEIKISLQHALQFRVNRKSGLIDCWYEKEVCFLECDFGFIVRLWITLVEDGGNNQINCVVNHPTLPVTITAHEDRNIRFFDNTTGRSCSKQPAVWGIKTYPNST